VVKGGREADELKKERGERGERESVTFFLLFSPAKNAHKGGRACCP